MRALKEMVFLPLAYPDLFARFRLDPPRGVLFHGPPGTGKTLVARALAASAARAGRPVAFFMRKGGDVLSKWVGEAERQVRRERERGRERERERERERKCVCARASACARSSITLTSLSLSLFFTKAPRPLRRRRPGRPLHHLLRRD